MCPDEGHGPDVGRLRHEFREGVCVVPQAEVGFGFPVLLAAWEEVREEARGLDAAADGVLVVKEAAVGGFAGVVGGGGFDEGRVDGAAEGEVEVGKHDVALISNEYVFGLQISVDNAQHVEVLEGQ